MMGVMGVMGVYVVIKLDEGRCPVRVFDRDDRSTCLRRSP